MASAPEGTFGPYVAYGAKGALALFSPGQEPSRRWVVQPLAADGSLASPAKNLADAPDDVSFAVLRANPAADRYIAVWSGEGAEGSGLSAAVVRADGTLLHVADVAHGPQPCLWADALPVRDGFVLLWASQEGGHARILGRKIDAAGELRGEGEVIEDQALAWQAEGTRDGAALAVTRMSPGVASLGTVVLHMLDAQARRSGDPVALSASPTAQLDVDVARLRDSLLVAWTDRRELDSRVWVAATDLAGKVIEPARAAMDPSGDQALIAVVAPDDSTVARAMLVVDSLPHPRRDSYDATMVMLDDHGKVSSPAASLSIPADASGETMFAGAPGGFLVLSRGPDCSTSGQGLVPWYVRIQRDQTLAAAAPLRWGGPNDVVATAWAPGCIGDSCFAIGADANSPATVVSLQLDAIQPGCAGPWTASSSARTNVWSNRAIAAVDAPVSSLAAASAGAESLVAWVSYFVEGPGSATRKPPTHAPGDPSKPTAAEVVVQHLDEHGSPTGDRKVISVRGYSPGGIAMAIDPATKDSCVAWVARDFGDPQVFLTKIGADGSRKAQRMLTRARGDASDVAVLRVDKGWVIAWVDGRDGNGEVYAAKVDDALRSAGPEVRVTQALGDASEVSLIALGDEVLVTYGDTRDKPDRGMAAPYYRRLRLSNLAPIGEDRMIARSRLHARSVRFVAAGGDVVATWLEVPIPGTERDAQDRPGLRLVRFEPVAGQPVSAPLVMGPASGEATAYALQCSDRSCNGVVSVDTGHGAEIESFTFDPRGQPTAPVAVAALGGPAGSDVCPILLGDALIYADAGVSGEERIRRATLRWPGP